MIGLGSNRLSVCRRGGMSVTQAGKGGMEWLAGGRLPSWATPYSAQATVALLAQFPTQWPTIRDYGFAHPEIVGYMNAYAPEDAKIAYSLVPTLGVRWTGSTGTQYINLGYYPLLATNDFSVRIKFRLTAYNRDTNILGSYGNSPGRCYPVSVYQDKPFYGIYGTNVGLVSSPVVTRNEWHEAYVEYLHSQGKQRMVIDGVQTLTSSYAQSVDVNFDWYVFARNENNAARTFAITDVTDIHINEVNRREFKLVPFIHDDNGTKKNGLLDMVGGQFYPNLGSGSFTISELPSS